MDVVKTAREYLESLQWDLDVLLTLGGLAMNAGFSPDSHLLLEAMPNELCSHKLSSGPYGWMG